MDLKRAFYRVATFAWMGLVVGAWIAVDLGYAEPWLSFSEVPGGSAGGMAGVLVALVAGWYVVGRFNVRHESAEWREAGQQAGFHPTGDGEDTRGPELTGTVDGRTVTARYDRRTVKRRGGEGSTSSVPFTWGETELAAPADEGVVVGTAGARIYAHDGVGILKFDEMAETVSAAEGLVAVETGDLVLVGTSAAVEAVADGLSGRALRAIRDLNVVSIGDASGVVARWAEARNEEMEGFGSSAAEYPVENLVGRVPGDAATVTVETETRIRDGDELRRFAEGVVAIADGFEEATARTPASG